MLNSEVLNTDKHWLDLFPSNAGNAAMRPLVQALTGPGVRVFNANLNEKNAALELIVRGSRAFREVWWRLREITNNSWHDVWRDSSLPKEPLFSTGPDLATSLPWHAALGTTEQRRQLEAAISIHLSLAPRKVIRSFRSYGEFVELPDEWIPLHARITRGVDDEPPTEAMLTTIAARYLAYDS
jgi:hypothetical protein